MRRWTAKEARIAVSEAAPVRLGELCPPGSILIVAPHPDDESLGCGGLIALAAEAGRQVTVVVLTDGDASHPGSVRASAPVLSRLRRREAREAVSRLGGDGVELCFFGAGDGRLSEQEARASDWLRMLAAPLRIGSVFVSWSADPHPDHQAAFRIARACADALGAAFRAYPVWGLTLQDGEDAGPRARCLGLDIASVLDRKRLAIAAHRSQTTGLIPDSHDGFRLSADDLSRHLRAVEPFFVWNGEEAGQERPPE